MADLIHTTADLAKLWKPNELAEDLKLKEGTVRQWRTRGIPEEYWLEVVASADRRKIEGVTLKRLAELAARAAGRPLPKAA